MQNSLLTPGRKRAVNHDYRQRVEEGLEAWRKRVLERQNEARRAKGQPEHTRFFVCSDTDLWDLESVPVLHGDRWGNWKYDAKLLTLTLADGRYELDLKRATTGAELCEWIFQVAGKTWASPECLGHLIQALDDIPTPQAHLCSGGANLKLDVRSLLTKKKRKAVA
jgi:hypothetical protein